MARISQVIAEPAVTLPASEAVGRVSGVIAEAAVTIPASEVVARVSGLVAEAAVTEVALEMRVGFVYAEVFSEPPVTAAVRTEAIGGGVQGSNVSTQG